MRYIVSASLGDTFRGWNGPAALRIFPGAMPSKVLDGYAEFRRQSGYHVEKRLFNGEKRAKFLLTPGVADDARKGGAGDERPVSLKMIIFVIIMILCQLQMLLMQFGWIWKR